MEKGRVYRFFSKNNQDQDIAKPPLMERLIHLLAVRPLTKQEVYAKMNSEGIEENERNQIGEILKLISYTRKNVYHLQGHKYNDVNEEWPFYTEEDRQNLKKRKHKSSREPQSIEVGSSLSGESANYAKHDNTHPAEKRSRH